MVTIESKSGPNHRAVHGDDHHADQLDVHGGYDQLDVHGGADHRTDLLDRRPRVDAAVARGLGGSVAT